MNPHERAQAFAKSALALMSEREIPPTPENFELFYAYMSGEQPELGSIIGDMIAKQKTFTPSVLGELRERIFDHARIEKAVASLSTDMNNALSTVMDTLEAAGRDTVAYGKTLSQATGELGGANTPAGVRKLVDGLLAATQTMEARAKHLEEELSRSSREVGDLRVQLDNLRKETLTDPLTNVANRKSFDTQLHLAVTNAKVSGEPLSLLMCDIDKFKTFNDTWGHQTGDRVLRLVANCLSENVKGRDTAARYGGEEFAVILPQTDLEDAKHLADHIRNTVESKKLVKKSTGDILGTITISIGVAQYAKHDSSSSLIRRADACLYAAKRSGRNCVIAEDDPRSQNHSAA